MTTSERAELEKIILHWKLGDEPEQNCAVEIDDFLARVEAESDLVTFRSYPCVGDETGQDHVIPRSKVIGIEYRGANTTKLTFIDGKESRTLFVEGDFITCLRPLPPAPTDNKPPAV